VMVLRVYFHDYAASSRFTKAQVQGFFGQLDQLWRDPEGWKRQALAGMSEDEVEAIEDSPATRLDMRAANWIGPELDAVRRQTRDRTGAWLPETP